MSTAEVTQRKFLLIRLSEKDLFALLEARHPEVKEFDVLVTKDYDGTVVAAYHRINDYKGSHQSLIFHGEKDIE